MKSTTRRVEPSHLDKFNNIIFDNTISYFSTLNCSSIVMTKPTHWNVLDSSKLKILLMKPSIKGGLDTNDKSKENVEKIRQAHYPRVPYKNFCYHFRTKYLSFNLNRRLSRSYRTLSKIKSYYEIFIVN